MNGTTTPWKSSSFFDSGTNVVPHDEQWTRAIPSFPKNAKQEVMLSSWPLPGVCAGQYRGGFSFPDCYT